MDTSKVISQLLRVALWNDSSNLDREAIENLSNEEWLAIHALALRQGVCAMLLDVIVAEKITIPRPIKMRFISSTDKVEKDYFSKVDTARQLTTIYSEHGIKTMILKGIGLAQLYPTPKHRPCSDLDIWLFGRQKDADKILKEKYNIPINEGHHHHTVFHINDVMVENHYDFIEQHSRSSKATMESYLKELSETEAPISINIEDVGVYIPGANLNALFLIMHAGAHFAADSISIRHLTDWALFLKHYSKSVNWNKLLNIAEQFGCFKFIETLNSVCIEYIGMPECYAPCNSEDKQLVDRFFNNVLSYKQTPIPDSFFRGWIYRLKRRFSGTWRQKMVYKDNIIVSFVRSFLTHIIHPNHWRE